MQHLKCTTAERTLACRVSKQRRRSGAPLQNGPGYCCTLVYNNLLRTSFVRKCRRRQILPKTNCPSFRHQNFCQIISFFFLKWSVFNFQAVHPIALMESFQFCKKANTPLRRRTFCLISDGLLSDLLGLKSENVDGCRSSRKMSLYGGICKKLVRFFVVLACH